jgi:hypothetical protein
VANGPCVVGIGEHGRSRVASRVRTTPEKLVQLARLLAPTDRVVLEATGNAWAFAQLLEPHVTEVVLAHPHRLRAIAEAEINTDKVDALVFGPSCCPLAQTSAALEMRGSRHARPEGLGRSCHLSTRLW